MFMILILLIGVVGGLFLVLSIIYFYLLYLKRRYPLIKQDQTQHLGTHKPYNFKSDSQNEVSSKRQPPTFTYQLYDNRQDFLIESGLDKHLLSGQDAGEAISRSRHSSIASAFRQFANRNPSITNESAKNHLLDLTSDPSKIHDVFPLVQQNKPRQQTQSPHQTSRPTSRNSLSRYPEPLFASDKEENIQSQSRRNTIASQAKQPHNQRFSIPSYSRQDTLPSKYVISSGSSKHQKSPRTCISQDEPTETPNKSSTLSLKHQPQSNPTFLQVDEQQFIERAQSSDMLFLKPDMEDDDSRRASFDTTQKSSIIQTETNVGRRRPGTGRKLPSTEIMESKQNMQLQQRTANLFDLPQILAPQEAQNASSANNVRDESPRRSSYVLSRMPAIESEPMMAPRKQTSSPLPRSQHLYQPGHIFSMSWNAPDRYSQQQIVYERRQEEQPLKTAYISARGISNYDSTEFEDFYHPQQSQFVHYAMPTHTQLISTPRSNMLSLPLFQRQAKSMGEWNDINQDERNISYTPRFGPTSALERRAISEHAERHLMRQSTVQHLHPTDELSRRCQKLWYARGNLASSMSSNRNSRFASEDYSDAGASTSFDSVDIGKNTDVEFKHDQRQIASSSNATTNRPSIKTRRPINADVRRQEFRSLLTQRQMATSSKAKQLRQPDYDISTDEEGMVSDSVASSSNIFASSVESSEPSTTGNRAQAIRTYSGSRRNLPASKLARVQQNYDVSRRDFSVDSRSDSIFRDFIRVDSRFEGQTRPLYIERDRAPTLPSRFRPPTQKSPNVNFSNSIASTGNRFDYQQEIYQPHHTPQTYHYSLIRR